MLFRNHYITIIYAISLTITMIGLERNNHEGKVKITFVLRCLLSFLSIVLLELIPIPFESHAMLLFVPALFICFYRKGKKLQIFQDALNAVLFLFIIIVLFGSPILFMKMELRDHLVFQIGMGILVLVSSFMYAYYLRTNTRHTIKSRKASFCSMLLKCLILVFFSLVLPQFHIENIRLFYLSQW